MKHLTRREFLKTLMTAGASVCIKQNTVVEAAAAPGVSQQIGVLVDTTRCIGCRACVRTCNEKNHLPQPGHPTTVWGGGDETLTYHQWTIVNLEDGFEGHGGVPVKKQCMHCLDPACVAVCPVGAMYRLSSGAVIYRKDRCVGCRYCVFACPFGIPKFQWDSGMTPVVGKCQFCAQTATFSGPACVSACPTGALKFGPRDAMLFEARARIHSRPDRYIHHIYGEKEAGGTSWLYLSSQSFEKLGFAKDVPLEALPTLTRMAMEVVPAVVTVLAVALSFLSYVFRRNEPVRQEPG